MLFTLHLCIHICIICESTVLVWGIRRIPYETVLWVNVIELIVNTNCIWKLTTLPFVWFHKHICYWILHCYLVLFSWLPLVSFTRSPSPKYSQRMLATIWWRLQMRPVKLNVMPHSLFVEPAISTWWRHDWLSRRTRSVVAAQSVTKRHSSWSCSRIWGRARENLANWKWSSLAAQDLPWVSYLLKC